MYNFCYVTKKEAQPVKKELYEILHKVQDEVREYFTFQIKPVGSSSRNMITYDEDTNIGFDFDFDIEINDEDEDYEPKEIRNIIKNAIDRVAPRYGYCYCENSTRVLTIKKIDRRRSRILHSCDLALVYNCDDGRQQYIRFNKKSNSYSWEYQGKGFKCLPEKIKWLKAHRYWGELRKYYLDKKNNNPAKHSRSIFAESINEMYMKKR